MSDCEGSETRRDEPSRLVADDPLTLLKDFSARMCRFGASKRLPGMSVAVSSVPLSAGWLFPPVLVDDRTPVNVFAPALAGFEAMGVKSTGVGTVYGAGVMVTAGAVTVCQTVSFTVL